MLVFEERGNRSTRRKTLGARTRTNNKLNPHIMTPSPRIEPGPHWWEGVNAQPQRHPCSPTVKIYYFISDQNGSKPIPHAGLIAPNMPIYIAYSWEIYLPSHRAIFSGFLVFLSSAKQTLRNSSSSPTQHGKQKQDKLLHSKLRCSVGKR